MRDLELTNEQMMWARDAKHSNDLPKAAYIVSVAAKDVLLMRLTSDMQDQADMNDGRLPEALNEQLRIVICTLKAKFKSKDVANWVLGNYYA